MKKIKRILALAAVIILAGLYIATLVTAFIVTPATVYLFRTSIIATIMIPILMYVLLFIYRLIHPESVEDIQEKEEQMENKEEIETESTGVKISNDVIAVIAGVAASEVPAATSISAFA